MRPLLLALLLLLTGCMPSVAVLAPTPTPAPPPREESERLYRVLALHATIHATLLDATANNMSHMDSLAMILLIRAMMDSASELIQMEYPVSLASYTTRAINQHNRIQAVLYDWLVDHRLSPAQAATHLQAIDANETWYAYADWLVEQGLSPVEVNDMGTRWQIDVHVLNEQWQTAVEQSFSPVN